MSATSGYFELLGVILARLRERLDAVNRQDVSVLVYPLTTSVDGSMPAPCILVRFDGHSVTNSESGFEARMVQSWLLEVCVRYGVNDAQAQAALEASGQIMDVCMAAFVGWQAPGRANPTFRMGMGSAPKPALDNGYYYLPIGLESHKTINKNTIFTL